MGAPGQQQPKHVAQIVPGVGNERDRVCKHAENDLRDHKRNVERRRDGKSPAEIRRRVAVPAMAVIVAAVIAAFMIVVDVIMVVMVMSV